MIIPIQREEIMMKSSLKSTKPVTTTTTIIPTMIDTTVPWKEMSALSIFEPSIKRWRRDDIEDYLLPSFSNRSLLKERFGDMMETFSNFDNVKTLMIKDHPIRIETFNAESDKYVLTLNVKQFKPEELQVKITDSVISISAKHEEKKDPHNFSCQEFSRNHSLPAGVKADDVKCELSSGGVLTISAKKPVQNSLHNSERTIPIQHIGLPTIRV